MPRHLFKTGDRCDEYEIIDLLGAGGFAEVYKAKHTESGEVVALKCLQLRYGENRHVVERMKAEAELLNTAGHNNLVEVLDFGKSGDVIYMAMELLVGRTLREVLEEPPYKVPLARALYIAREIADGLDAAHERGVVHRDLKPENVFLTDNNHVKVLDLGAGKFFGWGLTSTVPGFVMGTPMYMAPEHVTGDTVDARTDVYSLGVMLYEMIGEHPLNRMRTEGASKAEIAALQLHFKPPPLTEVNPEVPEEVSALVEKAMAKRPEQRFSSMSEVARALRVARTNYAEAVQHREDLERVVFGGEPRRASSRRDTEEAPRRGVGAGDGGSPPESGRIRKGADEVTTAQRGAAPPLDGSGEIKAARRELVSGVAPSMNATTKPWTVDPSLSRASGGTERMTPIDHEEVVAVANAMTARARGAGTEPLRASQDSLPPMKEAEVSSPGARLRGSVPPEEGRSSSAPELEGQARGRWKSESAPRLASARASRAEQKKVASRRTGVMLMVLGIGMAALLFVGERLGSSSRPSSSASEPERGSDTSMAAVPSAPTAAVPSAPMAVVPSAAPAPEAVPSAAPGAGTSAPAGAGATPNASAGAATISATAKPEVAASEPIRKPKPIEAPKSSALKGGARGKPSNKPPVFVLE